MFELGAASSQRNSGRLYVKYDMVVVLTFVHYVGGKVLGFCT